MGEFDNKKMDVTIVNSMVLGSCWGITDRRVRQLREEGVISEVARGKFNKDECTRKYCEYLRQQINANTDGKEVKLNLDTEKTLHEKAKREKAELQLRLMKGEVHKSDDVEQVMTDMITNAKVKLLALPEKAASIVIGCKDVNSIENKIEVLILEALRELSEYTPELFINSEVIKDDPDDD